MINNLFTDFLLSIAMMAAVGLQAAQPSGAESDSLFHRALELQEAGLHDNAAMAWIEYADSGADPDFRASYMFISLVTEHSLISYYEDASRVYFWGLAMEAITDEVKELLHNELVHIEAMLGSRQTRQLRRMIDNGDTDFLAFLRNFWDERTLTPSDIYNERLLEHWERVNFAKQNFKTSPNRQFDDRGKIYVRFGEPARKRSGIFMYNPGFANYIITTRMEEGAGSGRGVEEAINTTTYMNTLYRVIDYHTYPSFEVWIYTDLNTGTDNTVYMFGNNFGGNEMRLKQSVDDFVPSAAYSMAGRNNPVTFSMMPSEGASGSTGGGTGGERESEFDLLFEESQGSGGRSEIISPALVLQLMYYRQLSSLDDFFGARYDEMLDRYMNTSMRLSQSMAREFQHINASRTVINQRDVPAERTSNTSRIHTIDTEVSAYRFLDEDMNPYLKIFQSEDVEYVVTFEELRKRNDLDDVRFGDYEIIRTIRVLDELGNQESRIQQQLSPMQEFIDPLIDQVTKVAFSGGQVTLETFAELYDTTVENGREISENSTLPRAFRGTGQAKAEVEAFEKHDGLFSSDVILGYTEDSSNRFIISHNNEIPENSTIQFYYEAYNLQQNEDGLYSFNLRYNLVRERSTLGRIIRLGRESSTSMEIENTTDRPRFSQSLEIVTENLQPGNYRLELIMTSGADETQEFVKVLPITAYER